MSYIYQVRVDIQPDQMNELEIRSALEQGLGYLRSLLPSETGYVTSHAMSSLDLPDRTQLVFQSVWGTWGDLDAHRQSSLAEDKVWTEFQPRLSLKALSVHIYEAVD